MNTPKPLRYSRQREKILELLKSRKDHPSADAIYRQMQEYFPSVSLGTVYRNLGVLAEQGLIIRIMHEEGPDRFDADIEGHSHFYCEKCGSIYDISDDNNDSDPIIIEGGHSVRRQTISYYGICSSCLEKSH